MAAMARILPQGQSSSCDESSEDRPRGEVDENWTIRQKESHAAQMRPQREDAELTDFVQLRGGVQKEEWSCRREGRIWKGRECVHWEEGQAEEHSTLRGSADVFQAASTRAKRIHLTGPSFPSVPAITTSVR
ncbi:hypothetical protein PM082_016954 [Marasmius tenuissimus]|nr:hypothetical protein PM082_016954 [Marasmius tenuissimus]